MDTYLTNVAIIGAGLGGCALALALSARNVRITVYESRSPSADTVPSGVILTPNGLRILDRLGVLARIKDRCYISTHRTFKNDRDETIRKTLIASEAQHEYTNHRVWRKILLDEMKTILRERSIGVKYDSKFNGIVTDDSDGVVFLINDTRLHASLVVGSDGINSSVRRYLAPDIVPEYTGIVGVIAHIKRASVEWPYEEYERNATIQGKPGAIFFIPEDAQAKEIMIGMQVQYPQQSRDDLDRLQANKNELLDFYRKGYDEWGPTARSIIDRVTENKDTLYIWPYMRMPKLLQWYSNTGRVVLVGDGAHAIPPSSGQGVNQALEDIYSLTLLLTHISERPSNINGIATEESSASPSNDGMLERLSFWQHMRQERIDAVFDWATNATNVQRLPEAERKSLIAEGKIKGLKGGDGDDMGWLYGYSSDSAIEAWTDGRT